MSWRTLNAALAAIGIASLSGCASGSQTLFVEVVTDLCPDVEGRRCLEERFDTVVVFLNRSLAVTREVSGGDTFLEGQRVAELRELDGRRYSITIELLQDGVSVARATRLVEIVSSLQVVRVALQSECAGVRCPRASDDPVATECVSGVCVDPRCFDPSSPRGGCGALCGSDTDCTASVACGEARCVESVCLEIRHDGRCGAGERCLEELGCFGGVLEGDPCRAADDCGETDFICCGGECRRPDCDDGNACTDDGCTRDGCVNTPIDAACDDLVFCNGADRCDAGTCSVHAGMPCSGAAICDEPSRACVSCLTDTDCPPQESRIGACASFEDTCDESGSELWRVTTYRCEAQVCVPDARDEARACARDRGGVSCGEGESTCNGGACRCGGGPVCGTSQYCLSGACWDQPRFEPFGAPSAACVDAALGPAPGLLMGYRLYGRPGARVHKYNRHASCGGGWIEGSETADAPAYVSASGVYEVLLDSPTPLPCDFPNLGLYQQYAEVDGIRVPEAGTLETAIYNTNGCGPALATCSAARTFCP